MLFAVVVHLKKEKKCESSIHDELANRMFRALKCDHEETKQLFFAYTLIECSSHLATLESRRPCSTAHSERTETNIGKRVHELANLTSAAQRQNAIEDEGQREDDGCLSTREKRNEDIRRQ